MLDDHAVFHPEQVIEGVGRAVPLAFADGQDKIALAQHSVDLGVLEHVALRSEFLDGRDDALKPIRNTGVVLGVALGADVVGDPCRVAAHQHIFDQCDGQSFVRLGLVQIRDLGWTVPKPLLAPVMTMVLWVSTWVVLLLARFVTDWYEYRQHSVKT
jgi:hypothetical protein